MPDEIPCKECGYGAMRDCDNPDGHCGCGGVHEHTLHTRTTPQLLDAILVCRMIRDVQKCMVLLSINADFAADEVLDKWPEVEKGPSTYVRAQLLAKLTGERAEKVLE